MAKKINQLKVEEYYRLTALLGNIQTFVEKHPLMTYVEFDYYVVHDMTLFSIEPDFDFKKLELLIQHLKKSTSAIKRIFNKPIIVLKDTDDVLPVENARIINQNTLLHLANHTQYVANITRKGIKPRKLLTRIYEDDYHIYENVIFCNFIDDTLSLIKKNRRILNSLLYASHMLKFNLLEKINHVNYFLALGKLHTGYIRDFSQYFNIAKAFLYELSLVSKAINPRLGKPIYRKNKRRNRNLPLKKTNIFLMQKDYRQIYKTYKYMIGTKQNIDENPKMVDFDALRQNYLMYIQILTIFAVGHFNFEIDPHVKINLNSLDVTFSYKGWTLDIFNNNKKEILLYFTKETTYRMMIIANDYDIKTIKTYKKDYAVDEVIVANQVNEEYLDRKDVYISMEDVDSFRRIQQMILRGMIYADKRRDVCPFCGGELIQDPIRGFYQCHDCMTQIKEEICPEHKKPFFYTDNAHLKKYAIHKSDFKHDEYWYYEKKVESAMYFRNITKINQNSEIICPYCHKVHGK